MKIQWKNKYSQETGYVKCLNRKEGYFENTYVEDEAKDFAKSNVKRIIKQLESYCGDNEYVAIEA